MGRELGGRDSPNVQLWLEHRVPICPLHHTCFLLERLRPLLSAGGKGAGVKGQGRPGLLGGFSKESARITSRTSPRGPLTSHTSSPAARATHPAPAWGTALYGDRGCRLLVATVGLGCLLLLGLLVNWKPAGDGLRNCLAKARLLPSSTKPMPCISTAHHLTQPPCCSKASVSVCTFAGAANSAAGAASRPMALGAQNGP